MVVADPNTTEPINFHNNGLDESGFGKLKFTPTSHDAVNLNLIAFSHVWGNVRGQIFAIFVIVDAVAEAAVGLGILIALFRNKETVLADEIDLLKW